MSRELSELAEVVAKTNGLEHEAIAALTFLVVLLLGLTIKQFITNRRDRDWHAKERFDLMTKRLEKVEEALKDHDSAVRVYQNNVYKIGEAMKKNQADIKAIKDDSQHERFKTDAQIAEVAEKMTDLAMQMGEIVTSLKDHLGIK